jgi:hypothetical protein
MEGLTQEGPLKKIISRSHPIPRVIKNAPLNNAVMEDLLKEAEKLTKSLLMV